MHSYISISKTTFVHKNPQLCCALKYTDPKQWLEMQKKKKKKFCCYMKLDIDWKLVTNWFVLQTKKEAERKAAK